MRLISELLLVMDSILFDSASFEGRVASCRVFARLFFIAYGYNYHMNLARGCGVVDAGWRR